MERNVDALLASSWGRAAAVELERELKKDPEKFGASLGRNAQEAFERHGQSQWTALSSATRKRMVGAWCVLAQGSRECPGNCYVWSASPAVHFMDVLGLCEPDWVVCSGAARVAAIGDIWKIGGNIKTCTPPEEKPCPTFWDRKGYPYIKVCVLLSCRCVCAREAHSAQKLSSFWGIENYILIFWGKIRDFENGQ